MIKFDLDNPEKAIQQMYEYFTGSFHCLPHDNKALVYLEGLK